MSGDVVAPPITLPAVAALLTVQRGRQTDVATFGALGGINLKCALPRIVTLERPWRDNASDTSCILPRLYRCVLSRSPHLGYVTPELLDVPGRSGIRIHILNRADQSEGCIGVGTDFGRVLSADGHSEEDGIVNSRVAFGQLMEALAGLAEFYVAIADGSAAG